MKQKPSALFLLGFALTVTITVWSLIGIARTPVSAQHGRSYERDRALENSIDIKNLKDTERVQAEKIRALEQELQQVRLEIAQARGGGMTLITVFGLILTALSIGQFIKLRK